MEEAVSPITKKNPINMIAIILIVVLVAIGIGLYFYFTKKTSQSMVTENTFTSQTGGDEGVATGAAIIEEKDFTLGENQKFDSYGLSVQLVGPMSYRVYLNGNVIDEGTPEGSSASMIPIDSNLITSGVNKFRVEVDAHPDYEFDESSYYDIGIAGYNAGDAMSTISEDNKNILARAVEHNIQKRVRVINMTAADYDQFFATKLPEDVMNSDEVQSYPMPGILLELDDFWGLKMSTMTNPKMSGDDMTAEVTINHLYDEKNEDISNQAPRNTTYTMKLDPRSIGDIEYNFYHMPIKIDAPYTIEGKITITLPTKEGVPYKKEIPFNMSLK